MRKLFAWLGMAMLAVFCSPAHAGDPLKPYVVLAFDTSGSMNDATGSGTPSCGGEDTRMNHARCAVSKIVNSYGDMVFALGRFRTVMGGTTTPSSFPSGCCVSGGDVGANNGCGAGVDCNPSNNMFELLTALVDGDNQAANAWVNLTGNTCTANGSDPEMWIGSGNTPLEGTLNGVKRYWQGLQADNFTIWPSNQPGFNPIVNDPTNTVFFPSGCNPSPTCTVNCCAEQCRPYITILMTDGAETCEGTPANGAASLLQTNVTVNGVARRYRIETKPIGFGIAAGNAQIESIAHAGGAPDVMGVNEGYYASDEQGLQLAISSILDDAIRTETCNNLDDDCDTLIDEDFPNKGGTCDNGRQGVCRTTGTFVCRADGTGTQCNAPAGPAAGTEGPQCNQLDDDCDGKVDEGLSCTGCTPTGESCNNLDDDCDTRVDEGITRQCGTGTCLGTERCQNGVFVGCDADTPTTETCNGLDENCDGVADGITLACSDIVTPGGPGTDNPGGRPGACANNPQTCICHPGTKTCQANGNGMFGACVNEQKPLTEVCNGLDDDCDGRVDEGTGGADCSSNCQTGTTVCENGVLTCDSTMATTDINCDGIDEDCDGQFDEDWVSSGACGTGMVCNGIEKCINGNEVCDGTPIGSETCDCADNDCDNRIDEQVNCGGGGATCTGKPFCQCALPCQAGEFPCSVGQVCLEHPTSGEDLCVVDKCMGKQCAAGEVCQIEVTADGYDGVCKPICDTVTCSIGTVCVPPTGECKADDCSTFPDRCAENQTCRTPPGGGPAECVTNPCFGVECPSGQNCVNGQCFGSCADVNCPDGQRCRMGICETDPCGEPCPFGQVCNDVTGECIANGCEFVNCPAGQWCNPNNNGGTCEPDPCVDLPGGMCPNPEEVCLGGTCYDPNDFTPDGGTPQRVTTGGGGGCNTGSDSAPAGSAGLLAFGLALLLGRRRASSGRASKGGQS